MKMNVPEHIKALYNIFKLCFYLCLMFHVIGCAWFMVVSINKDTISPEGYSLRWVPPTFWGDYSECELFTNNSIAQ